jgi:hypothetical protein
VSLLELITQLPLVVVVQAQHQEQLTEPPDLIPYFQQLHQPEVAAVAPIIVALVSQDQTVVLEVEEVAEAMLAVQQDRETHHQ